MAGFLARGAVALGKPLLKPAVGAGIGFTSQGIKDAFFDDGDEVDGKDYLVSGGLGALLGGAGSLGKLVGGGAGKIGLPWASKLGSSAAWGARAGGGLGMLGALSDYDSSDGDGGGWLDGILGSINGIIGGQPGPVQLPGLAPKNPLLEGGMYGSIGEAPTFNKTLEDYLQDKTLGGLADAQIIKANAALGRENRDTRLEEGRNVRANSDAGQTAINQIGQIRRENSAQNQAVQQNARSNQQHVVQEADRLAEDVGASIIADDHTRHDLQAESTANAQDVASRQAADSKLLERMATAGQDALGTLSAAEALSTKANANEIRSKATDAIAINRQQASDNWLERPNILGSLADTAIQRDLQSHQMALQSWGQKLDALNSWRSTQMEAQKAANPQMDPSMLNTLMNFAMQPSGYTQKGVNKDDGTEWSYDVPTWGTWDPSTVSQYGGMMQGYFGVNPFAAPSLPGR